MGAGQVWARILMYGGRVVLAVGSYAAAFALIPPRVGIIRILVGFAAAMVLMQLWVRLLRRQVLVSVVRECLVAAPPERVWALLSSAEAWSLRPGFHAFGVPPLEGMPPLLATIRVHSRGVSCSAQELIELPRTAGQPGRSLLIRSATRPGSPASLTIRVAREGSGTRVVVTAQELARLASVFDVEVAGRKVLTAWLDECAAVLAGDRDRPGQEMSPDVLAALAAPLSAGDVTEASASVLIAVDPARAWEVVWDPATRLPGSNTVAAGFVPGRPVGQAGEIQYVISTSSQPDGALLLHLNYVCDMEPGRMARTRISGPIHSEALYRIEPESDGTRLSLTYRFADPRLRKNKEKVQANVEKDADNYKVLLEGTNTSHQS